MSDEVLTKDEVGALLTGVESGEIEVQSADGPRFAVVKPHDIPRRSRIATKSLPKLELLNDNLAERLKQRTQKLLNCELGVTCRSTGSIMFADVWDSDSDALVAVEFSASPFTGRGAIVIDANLINQLVELFFGGGGNEKKEEPHGDFTPGVMRVVHAYADIVLTSLRETWEPIQLIEPEQQKTESSTSLLTIADETDSIVQSIFDFSFAEHDGTLEFLMPSVMLETLLPIFKGDNREPNPARDKYWEETFRDVVTDVTVDLSTTIGQATMTLSELICLEPGDIINIENPTKATVHAQNVRLIEGRFGVHGGKNAIEASHWFADDTQHTVKGDTHG